jgi:uncharacterized protein YutE (UPF0331/DUF86 family)
MPNHVRLLVQTSKPPLSKFMQGLQQSRSQSLTPGEDYRQAVRNLDAMSLVEPSTVAALERLPGFRNVLVHEYVALDLERAVEAMDQLDPVEELAEAVRRLLS